MTRADAVLFDLDGVLVDSRRTFVAGVNATLRAAGLEPRPAEELHRFVGPPIYETFETLLDGAGDGRDRMIEWCVEHYRARYRKLGAAESDVFEGIPEALAELSARVPLVVATTKSKALADPLLDELGLSGWFTGVAGPALDARHEPKAETMARALRMLPPGCERPVMVGDRRYDVEGARHHGIPCVGVLWGIGTEQELREAGADVLAAAPADLPALLS